MRCPPCPCGHMCPGQPFIGTNLCTSCQTGKKSTCIGARTPSSIPTKMLLMDLVECRHRKTRVDEVKDLYELDAGLGFGVTGADAGGVDDIAMDLLKAVGELPFVPELPSLEVPQPPQPGISTLPKLGDLTNLTAILIPKPVIKVARQQEEVLRPPWRIEDSIFAPKPKENDSKSYWDRPGVYEEAFDQDWQRCFKKSKFQKMLDKYAKGEGSEDGGAAIAALQAEMRIR